MDETVRSTAEDTGDHPGENAPKATAAPHASDEFSRLLARLDAPTTEAVGAPTPPIAPNVASRMAPAFGMVTPVPTVPSTIPTSSTSEHSPFRLQSRAPELIGADELAATPRPFPPAPDAATPLIVPATDLPASGSSLPSQAPARSDPFDFSALLATPSTAQEPPDSGPLPLFGTAASLADEPDIGRPTVGEWIILVLAVIVPPLGLIAAIVGSIGSARRRGWVVGVLKVAIAIGIVLTVVVGILGYIGYSALQQQQAHDRTAAASAAFCATIKADPTMSASPDFGWPAVSASIPDSLVAMQAYEDKWMKLAQVSPDGIKPGVQKVATAAKQIISGVTVSRTVNDASNISAMSAAASDSGIPAWNSEYCG